jgi:hypothetical protein
MTPSAAFLEHGNVEPHAPLLKQPPHDQQLFKFIKPDNFVRAAVNSYLHFQRVDSYVDFPGADVRDGEQPARDRVTNAGVLFEGAGSYSVADYYDTCRARTYACSFSLRNLPHMWERYGEICVVFDFGKLKSTLNQTIGGLPGQSALRVGDMKCRQIFHINYGLVDYVDTSAVQTNTERLPNPIMYAYMKARGEFSDESELRITLATLGIGNFALADNTFINFPPSIRLQFDFRAAYADGTIVRLMCRDAVAARYLAKELAAANILINLKDG